MLEKGPNMSDVEVVIVDAVRTPIGKRRGGLSALHSADLLGTSLTSLVERTGISPAAVDQVIGGCVSQVGMQSFNVTRTAWLGAGLPASTPASTVDAQCGSSQQAANLVYGLLKAGVIDVGMACGVESMSQVPLGSNSDKGLGLGRAVPKSYFAHHEITGQFEAAERIAEKWSVSRDDADGLGLRSQQLAAQAWEEDRFANQVAPVEAPDVDDAGAPVGTTHRVTRDEGLRATTREALGALAPVAREDGVHTAGTSSQISDGSAAILMTSLERAGQLGLQPIARVVDACLVGVDPVMMLTGPIDATQRLLARTGRALGDIDLFEINEAFASVVLAWARELSVEMDRVNPNGGAIALGHPLGATGVVLLTKAVHELRRADLQTALITMCCGGGVGTGTIVERV
jgi:acetyl-CoA C-acetyltransferase